MAKSLMAEIKAEIVTILKQRYPDFYRQFRFKTRSWSTGGDVEIIWTDGPAYNTLQELCIQYKNHFTLTRKYSQAFIERVATEYCQCKGCEIPSIIPFSDGSYWLDVDHSKDIPYKEIVLEMRKLDEKELPTLAYRPCMIGGERTPERAWIVRRKDYSHGKYPHLAIAREHSYTSYERKLFKVRRRINENWVEVVQYTSLALIDNIYELDARIAFWKQLGREY